MDNYQNQDCLCLKPRTGALLVSACDLVIGLAGTVYFILHSLNLADHLKPELFLEGPFENSTSVSEDRLDVFESSENKTILDYEISEKEIQIVLYLYFLFVISVLLLGIILIFAVSNENVILAKVSIVLSLLNIFGTVAGIIGLFIVSVHWFLVVPIFLGTLVQVYFFWVIYDFHRVCGYAQPAADPCKIASTTNQDSVAA